MGTVAKRKLLLYLCLNEMFFNTASRDGGCGNGEYSLVTDSFEEMPSTSKDTGTKPADIRNFFGNSQVILR
jgi:hypothetical protein